MKYLSHEYKILRYIWKTYKYGLTTAHLKCMKHTGQNFLILREDEEKEKRKELNPRWRVKTDGEIDYQKMKDLFVERQYMTVQEFDDTLSVLRSEGHLHNSKMEIMPNGANYFESYETVFQQEAKKRSSNASKTKL